MTPHALNDWLQANDPLNDSDSDDKPTAERRECMRDFVSIQPSVQAE